MRVRLAAWLDRHESQARRYAERFIPDPAWLKEFRAYLGDPRLTLEEVWVRYAIKRMDVAPRFASLSGPAEALAFYRDCDYMLWRNLIHRRHSAWRRVLWTMRGPRGTLLELGCGIAPIGAYCASRRRRWSYWLCDVPSPHRAYGEWRVRQHGPVPICVGLTAWRQRFDVITAFDVFEHLPAPHEAAEQCVAALRPGGYLHWNFIETSPGGLDFATPEQRARTRAMLLSKLRLIYDVGDYSVSRRET